MRLLSPFYKKSALELAPELLGKLLCRHTEGGILKYRITETECYCGIYDTACHAHKGRTARTEIMYNEGGYAYIYLCYGIHSLFNVVTGEKDCPEAVLIRGVVGFSGPGRLTKAMNIDRSLNKENLVISDKIWIEDDGFKYDYKTGKRIGIDYATPEYREKLWRFY